MNVSEAKLKTSSYGQEDALVKQESHNKEKVTEGIQKNSLVGNSNNNNNNKPSSGQEDVFELVEDGSRRRRGSIVSESESDGQQAQNGKKRIEQAPDQDVDLVQRAYHVGVSQYDGGVPNEERMKQGAISKRAEAQNEEKIKQASAKLAYQKELNGEDFLSNSSLHSPCEDEIEANGEPYFGGISVAGSGAFVTDEDGMLYANRNSILHGVGRQNHLDVNLSSQYAEDVKDPVVVALAAGTSYGSQTGRESKKRGYTKGKGRGKRRGKGRRNRRGRYKRRGKGRNKKQGKGKGKGNGNGGGRDNGNGNGNGDGNNCCHPLFLRRLKEEEYWYEAEFGGRTRAHRGKSLNPFSPSVCPTCILFTNR